MKNYEIGSDFYITPEVLDKINSVEDISNNDEISKHILKEDVSTKLIFLGRFAIDLALKDLSKDLKNKRALIPAYTCETVIQPFLDNSFEVFYYEVDKNLNVKISEINRLIKKHEIEVVLLQPMFGFNTIVLDENILDIKIILDNTQGYFSKTKFNFQDYTIVSLRKWFGIPDGAILTKNKGKLELNLSYVEDEYAKLALKAFNAKYNYLFLDNISKKTFREAYQRLKHSLSNKNVNSSMSNLSKKIIRLEDFEFLKKQRRQNFNSLLEYFKDNNQISEEMDIRPVFKELGEGTVPLYFPLYINENKRNLVQKYMAENNIYCPVIWPIPKNLDQSKISEEIKWIYNHILVIPIDQRYNENDINYIIHKLIDLEQ